MLALRANRVVSVDQLIYAVWGEEPPPTARGQVQTSISTLRKVLDEAGLAQAIKTRSSGYVLDVADEELDSAQFGKLVAAAYRQAAEGQTEVAADTLRNALDLWRGPALDGIRSYPVRNAAAILEDARLTATEERARLELELGRHEKLTGELQALLAEHPWRERLYGLLMLALYRAGRQAEALEVCRRARSILTEEVGIEPGQELQDLERAMLLRDPSLDLVALPAEEPVTSPRQLPGSVADFVGRDGQIAEIRRYLSGAGAQAARFAVPIVGISGRGGVGKSTFALRVAHELGEAFPDGHIYVDLQEPNGETSANVLLARFLRALGVNGSLVPEDVAERAEMYRSRLAGKRLLLLLDNATSEQQVLPLLPGSPSCAVIVTSRVRLVGLPGAYQLALEAFDRATSIELLENIVGRDRLRAEPEATAQVAKYCGGLPLALRVAGARLASRPHWRIAELARRLKNEARRLDELSHHGLAVRSSIATTYHSLPADAQRLFRLFAVIEAPDSPRWVAAALLDVQLDEADEVLERLVDAHMVDVVPGPDGRSRYRFHDLIRVYARGLHAEAEDDADRNAVLERMLRGWLTLAEEAHRKVYGGDYTILHGSTARLWLPEWADDDPIDSPMDWLENERVALVSAIRQAAAAELDELCWDLALTSVSLFEVRGYIDDWRETAELAHSLATRAGNSTGIAAMLYSLGTLHVFQKRLTEADRLFGSALEIFESGGNIHGQALVLRNAALVDRLRGNFDAMLTKYEDSLGKMRAVGDLIGQASILSSLAKFRIDEGEIEVARPLLSEAHELCRRANYRRGEAHVMSRFAELYRRTGPLALARQALNEVLQAVREMGDRMGEAYVLYGMGVVRRDEGRLDSAEATLAHALALAERIGDRLIEGQACYTLGEIAIARVNHPTAAAHLDRAKDLFTELGSSMWLARTYMLLSEVRDASGDPGQAQEDLAEAGRILSRIDSKQSAQLLVQLDSMVSAMADQNDLRAEIVHHGGDR